MIFRVSARYTSNVRDGSIASVRRTARYFRSSLNCRHHALGRQLPKSANRGPMLLALLVRSDIAFALPGFNKCLCHACRHNKSIDGKAAAAIDGLTGDD